MLQKFIVEGQKKLNGTIKVSGAKNAALPILCAALLSDEPSEISNVPDIADIHTLLKIFEDFHVKTRYHRHKVVIDPACIAFEKPKKELFCRMRAAILLLGPLIQRFKEIRLPFPGGCVLGKRSIFAHTYGLKAMGVEVLDELETIHARRKKLRPARIIMPEFSVTATENLIMVAALTPGVTEIRLAAAEPHVQDLCRFLECMGAKIQGIGTHHLIIEGVKSLHGGRYTITGDYLEAGTFVIAGLITKGEVTIQNIETSQLDSFWQKLNEIGARFFLKDNEVTVFPGAEYRPVDMLKTAVYPGFPTDLQAPFAVLMTQARGQSRIFETLFDGRLNYLVELEKMKANVEILNPHQAIVRGPTPLRGVPIASCDIRAGAAMVLAALCAEGKTDISNIKYIDRGYEKLDQKLRKIGASIKRVEMLET